MTLLCNDIAEQKAAFALGSDAACTNDIVQEP